MADTLKYEATPASGKIALPVPQGWNRDTSAYVKTEVNAEGSVYVVTRTGEHMDAQITAELPAGTQNIGKVDIEAALPAGDNNIGNVDIASALPTGDNTVGRAKISDGTTVAAVDATSTGLKNHIVGLDVVLDKDLDSVDVGKMSKGAVTVAHNAITAGATSAEIDCRGYNALLVHIAVTVQVKNWTAKVQGAMTSGGTYADCYEGTTLMSAQTNATKCIVWKGIPDYVKIVTTEDEDTGTCTVTVQPLNV